MLQSSNQSLRITNEGWVRWNNRGQGHPLKPITDLQFRWPAPWEKRVRARSDLTYRERIAKRLPGSRSCAMIPARKGPFFCWHRAEAPAAGDEGLIEFAAVSKPDARTMIELNPVRQRIADLTGRLHALRGYL